MKTKLTASNVFKIPAPETGQIDVYDTTLPSFLLRISASGARTFAMMYRPNDTPDLPAKRRVGEVITGKPKLTRLSIGKLTDDFGLGEAREKARAHMHDIEHKNADPAFEKKVQAEDTSRTVKAVAEKFIERHVAKRGLRTEREIRRIFRQYVFPAWQDRTFTEIKRRDVTALLDQIEDNNGPVMADRVLAVIRKLFNWYQSRDDDFVSPVVKGMARASTSERARDRVLSDDEIRTIWLHLEGTYGALVKATLLTAQRREKIATMRWEDISEGVWTIPTEAREKNNPGSLKLPRMVLDIIEAQPVIAGNPYVFASHGKRPFSNFHRKKAELDKAAPIEPWVLHDLRRTAKTLMARAGVRPDVSERVLGHVITGVQGTYDRHGYENEKADALERLAGTVNLILNPPKDNVVEVTKARERARGLSFGYGRPLTGGSA